MGEVWLGWHESTEIVAAVKLLKEHPSLRGRARRFFDRERRVIARLSHPNIVSLFDVGQDFIAVAYIDGPSLAQRIEGGIDPATAVQIVLQIASALTHAHEAGVVHRDVKPANILLDGKGNAYLADFGLALFADDEDADFALRAGTPGYMAPEQVSGKDIGPAADQYALARTLLEMLAAGSVPPDLERALAELPRKLPDELKPLLRRACAEKSSDRFESVAAFATALSRIELAGFEAPVRVAPELRVRGHFAWCSAPGKVSRVSHDIACAEYRLSELGVSGSADWLDKNGFRDFGFSLYAHESRLGSVSDSGVLARASDLVVLMHGTLCTRRVWHRVAAAMCRNNPQAVVLVPDVLGGGVSEYRPEVSRAQLAPRAQIHAILEWLDLLGVRDLPTVLVGHSASAMMLLSVSDEELGERVSRVAVTPVFPSASSFLRWGLRVSAFLLSIVGRIQLVRSWIGKLVLLHSPDTARYREAERQMMMREFMHVPVGVLARFMFAMADARPEPGDRLDRCAIVVSEDDPVAPEKQVLETLERLKFPRRSVLRTVGTGHVPHMELEEHPEWTARNVDEIVRLTESMLLSAREGTPSSTVIASTLLAVSAEPATA
jgi:pimeloyl-ACP methyl ester carboxylesterase